MRRDAEKVYSGFWAHLQQYKVNRPSHPVTSVEAWTFGLDWWQQFVPSIDIYGLNSYGSTAPASLSAELEKGDRQTLYRHRFGCRRMGCTGRQERVKIEPSGKQKYDAIVTGYKEWINSKPPRLGGLFFTTAAGMTSPPPGCSPTTRGKTPCLLGDPGGAWKATGQYHPQPNLSNCRMTKMESGAWRPSPGCIG